MFGRKKQQTQPAPEVPFSDAVRAVLASRHQSSYNTSGLVVQGGDGFCSISPVDGSEDAYSAISEFEILKAEFGPGYRYQITVYGSCPITTVAQVADPGFRTYAAPSEDIRKVFTSAQDLGCWLDSLEGHHTYISKWAVSMTALAKTGSV